MKRAFVLVPMFAVCIALCQGPVPTASIKLDKAPIKAGAVYKVTVSVKLPEGFHAYQNPPTDKYQIPIEIVAGDKATTVSKVEYPKGQMKKVVGADVPSGIYEGTTDLVVHLVAPKKAGVTTTKLTVNYQLCNESSCYPPGKIETSVKIKVLK